MAKTTKYTAEVSEGRDELLDGKTIAFLMAGSGVEQVELCHEE